MNNEQTAWTTTAPIEPGYYWWRTRLNNTAEPVLVNQSLLVFRIGDSLSLPRCGAKQLGGEWYGPLKVPDSELAKAT